MTGDEEIKPVKKRPIVLIVVLGILGVIAMAGIIYTQTKSTFIDYNYTLYLSAKAINVSCPKMVGESIRLDSVAAKPGLQLWYYYSMTNVTKDEENNDLFCESYEESLVENLSGSKDMEEFGKNNVTLVFNLRDSMALEMCSIPISAEKYYSSKPK